MLKTIFFDFNGVIIDDEPLQMKAYQESLQKLGVTLTAEQYYGALGTDDRAFVCAVFEREAKELSEQDLQSIIERKSELHRELIKEELPLFPGVVTFLKAASRRYALGLVSMARRKEIDYVLERARLGELFTVMISAEDVRNHKPDAECYRLALERLNVKRQKDALPAIAGKECLVIEDAPPGIESARAVGMRTIGVTNTVSENELRTAGADVVTKSLADWTMDAVHHLFDE
jgi:HAD superfamily hydrolase (TIGR01509 family)